MSLRRVFACALPVLLATVVTHSRAVAADLAIGIGADVTAIDPHYHNVTPNNNVAGHIFDYLVLRDERQKTIPGLAESWKTVDAQCVWWSGRPDDDPAALAAELFDSARWSQRAAMLTCRAWSSRRDR